MKHILFGAWDAEETNEAKALLAQAQIEFKTIPVPRNSLPGELPQLDDGSTTYCGLSAIRKAPCLTHNLAVPA